MQDALVCSYSRTIARWLTKKFPGDVELDSSAAGYEEIINVFQLFLPAIEFQATTQGHFNLNGRIKQLTGLKTKTSLLLWLLDLFDSSNLPEPVKDELYGQLKVFVKWKFDPEHLAKNYLQLPRAKQWVLGKIQKSIQATRLIKQKINSPVLLSAGERSFLLDAMKISLALYYRETDPVTYADASDLEWFEMGRGLSIALVGMQKGKRLSLESYIGYMAFKNGIPIAYGGGWIWGQRCRIGISIYPAFRKGESARLFTQVLRLYYHHFNARHFVIRANQFGKDNPDGLRSGAFWFFYKLGFRPAEEGLKKLAGDEVKKIGQDKNYRSSLKTLRLFTASSLEWITGRSSSDFPDAESLSRKISDFINTDYNCSRKDALRSIQRKIRESLKPVSWPRQQTTSNHIFENWSLLVSLIPGFRDWDLADKKRLVDLVRMKQEGKERDHIIGMQELLVFWRGLNRHNF